MSHSLQRTSPKGPGERFVGFCTKCGKEGLTFREINEHCINPGGVTNAVALIEAIKGPRP